MEIKLRKANVVKVVASEHEATKLEKLGYKRIYIKTLEKTTEAEKTGEAEAIAEAEKTGEVETTAEEKGLVDKKGQADGQSQKKSARKQAKK